MNYVRVIAGSLVIFSLHAVAESTFIERTKDKLGAAKEKIESRFRKPVELSVQAERLLTSIGDDLQKIRVIVIDVLEKNTLNQKELDKALARLKDASEKITLLEQLDDTTKKALKARADRVVATFQALQEEAAVAELWVGGYESYVKDLDGNFKHFPNNVLNKPDNKKLYEALGFGTEVAGIGASFALVREKYTHLFNALKSKAGDSFESDYFRPYLRVLDYVFKTPYSKLQYDAYVSGAALYDTKAKDLKVYEKTIQKLFLQDLAELRIITGVINAEMR